MRLRCSVAVHSLLLIYGHGIINPQRACVRVTVVVLYVVCVSVISILPSRAFRHPTRGISGYSSGNAVKLFQKLLSSKVTSVINLPRLSQPFS